MRFIFGDKKYSRRVIGPDYVRSPKIDPRVNYTNDLDNQIGKFVKRALEATKLAILNYIYYIYNSIAIKNQYSVVADLIPRLNTL